MTATSLGVPGQDHLMDDLSPEGLEKGASLTRETLAALDGVEREHPGDDVDHVTRAAMRERLGLELEHHDALLTHATVNNIASPVQGIRSIFDMMPNESAEDWDTISERLARVPAAVEGYAESLRYAASKGVLAAKRQQLIGAEQSRSFTKADGFFPSLVTKSGLEGPAREKLEQNVNLACEAYTKLAEVFEELAENAPEKDAVGREAYQLGSRTFLGEEIDVEEAYEFGVEELTRLIDEQKQVASRLNAHYGNGGGDSIDAAMASLNADESLVLHGTDNLKAWMQELSDAAIRDLAGTHFDIPEELTRLECMIAETGAGGIYYTGPSEDFSRPGRMWWDTPAGVDTFRTWSETTTVYHEGVPGHHLQVGTQQLQAERLNRWRASFMWVSGHGEGWALYAERLMEELGYLTTDGEKLGMLMEQRMRAGRVVLDIGLHNELPVPEQFGGGQWTYERGWDFVREHWRMEEPIQRFEYHRYLGWAGQAPSYKLGQRVWEQLRDEALARGTSLRDFHREALELGSLPLSVLRSALSAPHGSGGRCMNSGLPGVGEGADDRQATVGTPLHEPLLLLASQSAGRKAVLTRAGIEFTTLPADVDEEAVLAAALESSGELAFEDQVLTLARAKAEASCAASEGGYVVLGGDSMLEIDGALVGKPRTADAARERWREMRGKRARLHSGHWLIDDRDPLDGGTGATFGNTASTDVYFAELSDAEIDAYVSTGEPLWVAGAFTIDGYGGPFIERIEGDHHAVIGLSLPLLRRMLAEISLPITDLWRPTSSS